MFQKIVIEGKTYFLIPEEFIESLVVGQVKNLPQEPIYPKEPPTTPLLNEFQPPTAPQTGEVPIAQGKPSEYRQKFTERRLGPYDVTTTNTANLSSLKPRQSKVNERGEETSFEEVSY